MKLLFDQNISFRITKHLSNTFKGCQHVSDCGLLNCEDPDIWMYAKKHNFSIVTYDSDFYDISLIWDQPPKIIWLRTGNLVTKEIANLLIDRKEIIMKFLNNEDSVETSCLEIF